MCDVLVCERVYVVFISVVDHVCDYDFKPFVVCAVRPKVYTKLPKNPESTRMDKEHTHTISKRHHHGVKYQIMHESYKK